MAQKLVPEAKNGLSKFKNEVASEMGVPFTDYNGNLTSKQCGSVGGEMVKRMVEQYEQGMKKLTKKPNKLIKIESEALVSLSAHFYFFNYIITSTP